MTGSAWVTVLCGDRPRVLPTGTTLADLVGLLSYEPNAIGTAVNGLFVARTRRQLCVLQTDDNVVLFQQIVGG